MYVRPKKALGQHFLKDEEIARRIVNSLNIPENLPNKTEDLLNKTEDLPNKTENLPNKTENFPNETENLPNKTENLPNDTDDVLNNKEYDSSGQRNFIDNNESLNGVENSLNKADESSDIQARVNVIEVGPGTGVLTRYLISDKRINLKLAEIDPESVEYLHSAYPALGEALLFQDFLKTDLSSLFDGEFMVIGNFPYNISSQIFFKILDYKESVYGIVGMLQKEVAERLASPPGNKSYGILSVLLQAWYDIEYLFTVHENSFIPPPKVKSGVIRLKRNDRGALGCDEKLFKQVVKTTFNQRRKTIRNSLKPLLCTVVSSSKEAASADLSRYSYLLDKRPEQLSVEEFVLLTLYVEALRS
jgi:16S rRNA (adenine1518-N6/adenine1519-N6)-dimethyltransferase